MGEPWPGFNDDLEALKRTLREEFPHKRMEMPSSGHPEFYGLRAALTGQIAPDSALCFDCYQDERNREAVRSCVDHDGFGYQDIASHVAEFGIECMICGKPG